MTTGNKHKVLKFGRVVFELCERRNRDSHHVILRRSPGALYIDSIFNKIRHSTLGCNIKWFLFERILVC